MKSVKCYIYYIFLFIIILQFNNYMSEHITYTVSDKAMIWCDKAMSKE